MCRQASCTAHPPTLWALLASAPVCVRVVERIGKELGSERAERASVLAPSPGQASALGDHPPPANPCFPRTSDAAGLIRCRKRGLVAHDQLAILADGDPHRLHRAVALSPPKCYRRRPQDNAASPPARRRRRGRLHTRAHEQHARAAQIAGSTTQGGTGAQGQRGGTVTCETCWSGFL